MDKLTKSFIRILKEKGIYDLIPKTYFMSIYIKTISINRFIKDLRDKYHIDITDVINLCTPKPFCRDVVVININDYNVFSDFLKENGIVWCNNKVFSSENVEHFTKRKLLGEKYYFTIDIGDNCKMRFSEYVNVNEIYDIKYRLLLEENEFYDYYNSIRKEMNDKLLFLPTNDYNYNN